MYVQDVFKRSVVEACIKMNYVFGSLRKLSISLKGFGCSCSLLGNGGGRRRRVIDSRTVAKFKG